MEEQSDRSIETLVNMFGSVLSKEVIDAIVESCCGDLSLSVEAAMKLANDCGTDESVESNQHAQPEHKYDTASTACDRNIPTTSEIGNAPSSSNQIPVQPNMSYAGASKSSGVLKKYVPKTTQQQSKSSLNAVWTDQLRKIMNHHIQGHRILIIMRGVPGSGKSYLAKYITEMLVGSIPQNYENHIYCTDDFFVMRGMYNYQKYNLSEAHNWNQRRANEAFRKGISPIIVDNTNVEIWEMEPYTRDGVQNGYIIEVVEPNTPWAKKANQLARKNTHNVPLAKIRKMLDNFQNGITGQFLKKYYGLSYPGNMVPPVMRKYPPLLDDDKPAALPQTENQVIHHFQKSPTPRMVKTNREPKIQNVSNEKVEEKCNETTSTSIEIKQNAEITSTVPETAESFENKTEENEEGPDDEEKKQQLYLEAQKRLEELEKVEQEWENGESWDSQNTEDITKENSNEPKPQRNSNNTTETPASEGLLKSVNECHDWTQISLFMKPWNDDVPPQLLNADSEKHVDTETNSTCMEIGDTDTSGTKHMYKIISATPRDINFHYMAQEKEKIPEKRMLDKSTMTNEHVLTDSVRCKNEEKHFVAFRKLFKNIARAELRDIFDKCCGDVNWAVDIVLDGVENKHLAPVDDENLSDPDEENFEQCECLAAYNIIPDKTISSILPVLSNNADSLDSPVASGSQQQRKPKKDIVVSDSSAQLKRQIEQNVVIAENHYSEHCLKIRKMRRGELNKEEDNGETENCDESGENAQDQNDSGQSNQPTPEDNGSSADTELSDTETDISIEEEKVVSVNLGNDFISQLDDLFGRHGMIYPPNIVPKISLPVSILQKINALWMESLINQMDEYEKQAAIMLKQDEELARQLATKEAELAQAGKEPEVPDFKEIMDMDFALSIYQKDVAEQMQSNTPNDMASRMTRDKLCNLFPDMSREVLTEILMAHDNNFKATVEVLLVSTGKSDVLAQKNGVSKFVMNKEMERQGELLKNKSELSQKEWPSLPKEKVDMSTVLTYRNQANLHFAQRNMNHRKAEDYIRRNMTQVASYYNDVATYHKIMFEQANSLAAVALIQLHSQNNPTASVMDFHYLRVGEAIQSLDLFLDAHITRLNEARGRGGSKYQEVYLITGRGLHSNGRPKIKPAVKKRLRERGLHYGELNPGLLTTRVSADNRLSHG